MCRFKVRVVIGFPSEFKRLDRIGCVAVWLLSSRCGGSSNFAFSSDIVGWKNHASVSTWGKIKNSSASHSAGKNILIETLGAGAVHVTTLLLLVVASFETLTRIG
uniref:(northern house mosquito) hypothetical protein n=1 Tax=Culex pipiens TaxID=7175 RepID=A0A8D8CA52_CULPI